MLASSAKGLIPYKNKYDVKKPYAPFPLAMGNSNAIELSKLEETEQNSSIKIGEKTGCSKKSGFCDNNLYYFFIFYC